MKSPLEWLRLAQRPKPLVGATPADVVDRYPAHLHMNLAPRLQGRGLGPRLLANWLAAAWGHGVRAVHLGNNPDNTRAAVFWARSGFTRLIRPGATARYTLWFGRDLDDTGVQRIAE